MMRMGVMSLTWVNWNKSVQRTTNVIHSVLLAPVKLVSNTLNGQEKSKVTPHRLKSFQNCSFRAKSQFFFSFVEK